VVHNASSRECRDGLTAYPRQLIGKCPRNPWSAVPFHAPAPSLLGATNGLLVQGSSLGIVVRPPAHEPHCDPSWLELGANHDRCIGVDCGHSRRQHARRYAFTPTSCQPRPWSKIGEMTTGIHDSIREKPLKAISRTFGFEQYPPRIISYSIRKSPSKFCWRRVGVCLPLESSRTRSSTKRVSCETLT
jgi:hypothetical protein